MMAVATDPCVAAATKAAQALGCVVLKLEQTQVITGVLRGTGGRPTGYGKTLCYAVPPAAFDFLHPGSLPSIVVAYSHHERPG